MFTRFFVFFGIAAFISAVNHRKCWALTLISKIITPAVTCLIFKDVKVGTIQGKYVIVPMEQVVLEGQLADGTEFVQLPEDTNRYIVAK